MTKSEKIVTETVRVTKRRIVIRGARDAADALRIAKLRGLIK